MKQESAKFDAGIIQAPDGSAVLFPGLAIFTEMPTHYAFELFGARQHYADLKEKKVKSDSIDVFLGDFDYEGPTQHLIKFAPRKPSSDGRINTMYDLALLDSVHLDALDKRFPGVRGMFTSGLIHYNDKEAESFKSFDGSSLEYPFMINNCLIANRLGALVRARYVNLLLIVPKDLEASRLPLILKENIRGDIELHPGIKLVRSGYEEAVARTGQLSTLYLRGAKETVLTKFLEDHAEIIKTALMAEEVFFQPEFHWVDGNPDPEEDSIQPDMMVRRKDGSWWVVEFKLPLLEEASITAGKHRRRRFIFPVADGIEQLYNYHDYFKYEANRKFAAKILKEEVRNPELMLIAGNSENVDLVAVEEAKRSRGPIDIMDYDTLVRLSVPNHSTTRL